MSGWWLTDFSLPLLPLEDFLVAPPPCRPLFFLPLFAAGEPGVTVEVPCLFPGALLGACGVLAPVPPGEFPPPSKPDCSRVICLFEGWLILYLAMLRSKLCSVVVSVFSTNVASIHGRLCLGGLEEWPWRRGSCWRSQFGLFSDVWS